MKQIIISMVIFILIIGCGKSADKMGDEYAAIADEAFMEPARPPGQSRLAEEPLAFRIERRIIKESWIRFEVDKYSEAIVKIKGMVSKHSGYINQENESSTDYSLNNNLSIRVPAENFDALVEELVSVAVKVDK